MAFYIMDGFSSLRQPLIHALIFLSDTLTLTLFLSLSVQYSLVHRQSRSLVLAVDRVSLLFFVVFSRLDCGNLHRNSNPRLCMYFAV